MTGPEHYQAAESLLQQLQKAQTSMSGSSPSAEKVAAVMAEAQVHATLALAAATAVADAGAGDGMPVADYRAWKNVAGASDGR